MTDEQHNDRAKPAQRSIGLFGVCAVSALAFILVAGLALGEQPRALDERVLRFFRSQIDPASPIGPYWLQQFLSDVTALGGWPLLLVFTLVLASYFLIRGKRSDAILLATSVVGVAVLGSALKALFDRSRPEIVPHLTSFANASFPSGHSASAAAVYFTLAAMLSRNAERPRERLFIALVAVGLVALVGFSRVYLGVHYPTDVLAGWSFGAAWASLVLLGARYFGSSAVNRPGGGVSSK